MTFMQELFGLFGIHLKIFLKINIFADFVIFVHTSSSGNAKKGGRKLRRTTTPNNINNIQNNDNGKRRAGLGRGADTRVG